MSVLPIHLTRKGAEWWHSDDYHSPNLSKASLGSFFFEVLKEGGYVGEIWPFAPQYNRSSVYISVYMTEEMKNNIESRTKFKFRHPPKAHLNSV